MGLIPEHLRIDSARVSQELETFIKTSVGDFNREGVIVGLSGGLDSSVVLALSAAALDSSKVSLTQGSWRRHWVSGLRR